MNYLLTIEQTPHQRIRVVIDGRSYNRSDYFPSGVKYSVDIEADPNYNVGVLNVEKGELTSDTIIRATPAELKQFTVEIKQTPHQLITLKANNKLYTQTVKLPYNTEYFLSVEADRGYEPGELNYTHGFLTNSILVTATGAVRKSYDYKVRENPIVSNISYTNRDVNAVRMACIEYVKNHTKEWTDFSDSDIGMTLIDIISGCVDLAMYYLDQQANECYLDRATEPKNIRSLIRTMNYRIPLESSALGEAIFTLKYPLEENVIIPKNTQLVSGKTGYNYVTKERAVITKGTLSISAPIIQGKYLYETQTVSYMKSDYRYYIDSDHVAEHSVEIKDYKGHWKEVEDAYLKYKGGRYFSVHKDSRDRTYVLFPWDYENQFPDESNSSVRVSYLETLGEKGKAEVGEIRSIISTIKTESGKVVGDNISVYNHTKVTGGQDTPDIYKMIVDAKANMRHMNRIVTLTDYKEAVLAHPGVFKALTQDWSSENTTVKKPYQVLSYVVSKDGTDFSSNFLTSLSKDIQENSICINEFKAIQADFYDYNIVADIELDLVDEEEINNIRLSVIEYLRKFFSYENSDFGQPIYTDEIWYQIKQCSSSIKSIKLKSPTTDYIPPVTVYPRLNRVLISVLY